MSCSLSAATAQSWPYFQSLAKRFEVFEAHSFDHFQGRASVKGQCPPSICTSSPSGGSGTNVLPKVCESFGSLADLPVETVQLVHMGL